MEHMLGDKYRILKEAGSGGGGRIFQVYDCRLDKVWAAKQVEKETDSIEEKVLGKVETLSFVRIVDVVEEGNLRYLIMDWIEGESLQEKIDRQGALPAEEVKEIAAAVCMAIGQLHAMCPPILYLDCKPSNIMLEKSGRVMLVDFGSAVVCTQGRAVPLSGSIGYAAPEQRQMDRKRRKVDERSDIYALGKTLYAALSGQCPDRPPYGSRNLRRINPAVPSGLICIVEKCTRENPNKRFQTMMALLQALEELEEEKQGRNRLRKSRAFITGLPVLASAWMLAQWLQEMMTFTGEHGIYDAIRQTMEIPSLRRLLFHSFLWFLTACVWQRLTAILFSGKAAYWEMKQSVLRTTKKPGIWCVFFCSILIRSAG